jgi:cold shock CspA family protein
VPIFKPPTGTHEGIVSRGGFTPERGFLFLFDEKERRTYFCHINDCTEAIFYSLQPGMRVSFEVFERRDRRTAAHRVRLLQ